MWYSYLQYDVLGPVSRAAGMDCECPLYRHVANKQKVRGTIL